MGRQYNKVEKRKRRVSYLKRKNQAARTKVKAKTPAPPAPPAPPQ